ncbi:MAG: hypothetical protein JNK87_23085 [Bryobacterales bacterium]|nr:hypothetical protein [Bryobacterales bacterium]
MAGAIKLNKTTQARTLRAGPPNMHLLSLQKLAQRTRSDRWEQYQRLAGPVAHNWEGFGSKPEWTATTRLLFDASGFDFNGPPPRRARPTMRIQGDPETVVNVRDLLDADETEEPVGLSFDPGPIVWEELDAVEAPVEEPATLAFEAYEIYEPPEPEVLGVRAEAASGPGGAGGTNLPVSPAAEETLEHILLAPADEDDDVLLNAAVAEAQGSPDAVEAVTMAPAPEVGPPALRVLEMPGPGLGAEPLLPAGSRLQLPSVESEPLRPKLVLDAPPAAPDAKVEAKAAVEVPAVEVVTAPAPPAEPAKPEVPVAAPAAAAPVAVPSRDSGRKGKKKRRQQDDGPVEEPADLGEDVEAGLRSAAAEPQAAEPAKAAAKASEPAAEAVSLESALPSFGDPVIAALEEPASGIGLKIGLAVLAVAMVGGGGYYFLGSSGTDAAPKKAATAPGFREVVTAGPVTGEVGWSTDYATDAAGKRLRQISLYRPTSLVTDYRVEFQGEVEFKALSWVVRGANTKSYYVCKIVPEKGNVARFVRYAVVNGQAETPVSKELPFAASLGTTYRVRADVVGSQFSVTIQDKRIDQWTETRLASGGFGVANEGLERGQVRNIQVWHLREASAR